MHIFAEGWKQLVTWMSVSQVFLIRKVKNMKKTRPDVKILKTESKSLNHAPPPKKFFLFRITGFIEIFVLFF